MWATQIIDEGPGINFVKNLLRQRESPTIYVQDDDFYEYTIRAGLIGVTAGTVAAVGSLLFDVEMSPSEEGMRRVAMHEAPMLMHPTAGAWLLALEDEPWALQGAVRDVAILRDRLTCLGWSPDALPLGLLYVTKGPILDDPPVDEGQFDAHVTLEEMVELGDVMQKLADGRTEASVLPALAALLDLGTWATLEPEVQVDLPRYLLKWVRPHYLVEKPDEEELTLWDELHALCDMADLFCRDEEVPLEIRKHLLRATDQLRSLLEKHERLARH